MKRVGRALGVRYVLEGSARKGGNPMRITAQLIEAETDKHVWAERYRSAETIAVAPAIADAGLHRAVREPPSNLDASLA